jgi:glycosyltransferase involved in cell wall biosynthesis
MPNISVVITTYNEEINIAAALDTIVVWADEILVVDSFSTDKTVDIIKTFPQVRLLQRAYYGPADQKNWAIPQAKNEWILLMDADERVTLDLRTEIEAQLRGGGNGYDAFWIGFTHFFFGKQVRYSGWQNDKTIRLIRRDKCRYNANRVHEEIVTEGVRVGFLKNKFLHFTFRDMRHFIAKQERYAAWSAEDYDKKTGRITYYHLFLKPIFRFFKHFILKKGFLDGKIGFIISAVAAWSVFLRYAKMMENRSKLNKYG